MLTARDLRKRYGATAALDGLSFQAHPGEVFGLLGPNGAGKTTAIQILAGLLRPDSGSVEVGEWGAPSRPATRRRIGLVPQSLALYEDLSAEENLFFFGRMYALSGARLRARVDTCLEIAGLTERRTARVSSFSGGMKRRLNLACALLHAPPLLLLDEPTVGVDPQSRNLLFERLAELKASGTAILYTTHYMEEAERLCDRVAILDAGRILALDTVPALVAAHGGSSHMEVELKELPPDALALPGKLTGNTLRLETTNPAEDLARLTRAGLSFSRLQVESAGLEDVFLNLTGRSLRDE